MRYKNRVISDSMKLDMGGEAESSLAYLEKQIMLHLSRGNITTISNFTSQPYVRLMSDIESRRILLLPWDYTSNIFTQGQSFNYLTNFNLLSPLLDSKSFCFLFVRLPITTTTVIITTFN